MRKPRVPSFLLVVFLTLATASAGPQQARSPISDVRLEARILASDWVRTASVANLNDLALRTSAFAGMVPGTIVKLDGRAHSADRVLMDSVNTIVGPHTGEDDAQAVRNITYTLDLIANGDTR